MEECGLDAIVATSPVNITYLTDYSWYLDPLVKEYMVSPGAGSGLIHNYAVYARGGEAGLVVRPNFSINAADIWVDRLELAAAPRMDLSMFEEAPPADERGRRYWELFSAETYGPSPEESLSRLLGDLGLTDGTLGVEWEGLDDRRRDTLKGALKGGTTRDCSNLLRLIRLVKSEDERDRLTRSAQINETAAIASLYQAKPGLPISDLVQHYREAVAKEGAVFDHYAYSVDGFGITTETPHTIRQDEVALVDFGCIYMNQFSDTGTTLALPGASPKMLERHTVLRDLMDAGMAAIRPGVRASSVHAAMAAVLEKGKVTGTAYGHGLGLEVREYPIIVPDNGLRIRDESVDVPSDLQLEEGMIFNLESPLYMPPAGALQIEETLLVTASGCEQLIGQDRSSPVTPK